MANHLGLVGVMNAKLGTGKFSTHVANTKNERIGHVLASPSLTAMSAVTKCGHEAFNETFNGDHRGFFLDFDEKELLGTQVHELVKPARRGINSKDRRNKIIYLKEKYKHLKKHDFFPRLQELRPPTGISLFY